MRDGGDGPSSALASITSIRLIPLLLLVASAPSCSLPTGHCDALGIQIDPAQVTLTVGQQFTAHLTLRRCKNGAVIHDPQTWSSQDTTVARVNASNGVTTAVGVGETQLLVTTPTYGDYVGPRVTVR